MVRAVADGALLPKKDAHEETGDMMILAGETLVLVSAMHPPYPSGE